MHRILLLAVTVVLATHPALSRQEAPPSEEPAAEAPVRTLLDSIRDDLVELRFEKALAAIEALLGEPGMSEAERAELLVLRSQTHVAFGDLDAAEEDYRLILRMRPSYRPDASLTPAKAVQRFDKVRAATIGTLRLDLDPADAGVTIDGRPVSTESGIAFPLVAGPHEVVAQRAGYDAVREVAEVQAGEETALDLTLIPNSRTVVLRTEPGDVEVWLDQVLVGKTTRGSGAVAAMEPAELIIENIPLGEHTFELRRPCFRTERMKDTLTVDLLDRTPKRYRTVKLPPARGDLVLRGVPPGSRVRIDGQAVEIGPGGELPVCPGSLTVDLELAGRSIWRSVEQVGEGDRVPMPISPRPNLALVGAEAWPEAWREFAAAFNAHRRAERPPAADLSDPGGWAAVALPEHTDLALAVIPAARPGAADRWYLYSPILRQTREVPVAPADTLRPSWVTHTWGFETVDSAVGGSGRVVRVAAGQKGGPSVGDRVVGIAGRPVQGTAALREALRREGGEAVEIEWITLGGESRKAVVRPSPSPRLIVTREVAEKAMVDAAWSIVDAICRPSDASAALANLALLFAEFGHHELALNTWRRVSWERRSGIGPGTTQYYAGQALERLGREAEAVEAYRRALSGQSTTFDDEGPRVAPAAADRLADLGVSASPG